MPVFKPKQSNTIDMYLDEDENNSDIEGSVDDMSVDNEMQIGGVDDIAYESDEEQIPEVKNHDDSDLDENTDDDSDLELDEEGEPIQKKVTTKKDKKVPKKEKVLIIEDEDQDDDDDYDENYLQKFDKEVTKNYINEFHPESLSHNYDEISKMSVVIKNSDNIIIDPLHKTIPFLTKYERARVLGQRAKQIETGSKPFINIPESIIDSQIIAELELKQKKIPFIIRRPIPGGGCEYWNLKDLELILF